jgi:serine/threonine protein kinase
MARQAAPEQKTTDGLAGEILASRYLIEHKLGEGAMGAVYRARHVKVGRPFAVKVLHRKLLEDKKIALRFEREAELAGRLHHPNVIGVVDVGETADGMRYMVMDFAEGSDLADLLREAPMPPERIIPLVRQMLEGLYHAHEAGLIHRDFKPENVIVERDDHGKEVPRIVDFGISILREGGESVDGTGRLTTNGLVLGTPHYMAPEQAVADPIDHRIDLFALGIVVYEMLSGKLPFDGAGAEVARANLLLDPPPISRRVPYLEVDPLLEAFAHQLMAKNRDRRPATAKKARELLDLIERDRPAAAATLGVPLSTSARTPQVTQPVARQPPAPESPAPAADLPTGPTERVVAPGRRQPSAGDSSAKLRPSALEAPPVPHPFSAGSVATAATPSGALPPRRSAAPETTVTDPLPWGDAPSSKRRWLITGGIGLAAAGALVAIAMGRSGDGDAKPPAGQKIAMTATTPEPAASAAPAPAPTPPPQPEATVAPAASDPPPTSDSPAEVQPAVPPISPNPDSPKPAPDPARSRPMKVQKPGSSAIKSTKPDAAKPDPIKSVSIKSEAAKPDAAKPDAAKPDAAKLTAPDLDVTQRWKQVEAQINALKQSPATRAVGDTLFARWLRIRIQKAQLDETSRRATMIELAELQRLINEARSKP